MWPGHLAPDDADLGAAHLLLTSVDVRDPLAGVEAASRVNPYTLPISGILAVETYLAAAVSSTPSILIRLVLAWVVCRLR